MGEVSPNPVPDISMVSPLLIALVIVALIDVLEIDEKTKINRSLELIIVMFLRITATK
ncbi:hypothetical protein R50072_05370 [Simiduia litorea]